MTIVEKIVVVKMEHAILLRGLAHASQDLLAHYAMKPVLMEKFVNKVAVVKIMENAACLVNASARPGGPGKFVRTDVLRVNGVNSAREHANVPMERAVITLLASVNVRQDSLEKSV